MSGYIMIMICVVYLHGYDDNVVCVVMGKIKMSTLYNKIKIVDLYAPTATAVHQIRTSVWMESCLLTIAMSQ